MQRVQNVLPLTVFLCPLLLRGCVKYGPACQRLSVNVCFSSLFFFFLKKRLLEHHSVWAETLLQALYQALQRGRALGLRHPEDHRYQSAGGNANTAPHT